MIHREPVHHALATEFFDALIARLSDRAAVRRSVQHRLGARLRGAIELGHDGPLPVVGGRFEEAVDPLVGEDVHVLGDPRDVGGNLLAVFVGQATVEGVDVCRDVNVVGPLEPLDERLAGSRIVALEVVHRPLHRQLIDRAQKKR